MRTAVENFEYANSVVAPTRSRARWWLLCSANRELTNEVLQGLQKLPMRIEPPQLLQLCAVTHQTPRAMLALLGNSQTLQNHANSRATDPGNPEPFVSQVSLGVKYSRHWDQIQTLFPWRANELAEKLVDAGLGRAGYSPPDVVRFMFERKIPLVKNGISRAISEMQRLVEDGSHRASLPLALNLDIHASSPLGSTLGAVSIYSPDLELIPTNAPKDDVQSLFYAQIMSRHSVQRGVIELKLKPGDGQDLLRPQLKRLEEHEMFQHPDEARFYNGVSIQVEENGKIYVCASPRLSDALVIRPVENRGAHGNGRNQLIKIPEINPKDSANPPRLELRRGDRITLAGTNVLSGTAIATAAEFAVPDAWFNYSEALLSLKENLPESFIPEVPMQQALRLNRSAVETWYNNLDAVEKDAKMRLYMGEILNFDPERALKVLTEKNSPDVLDPSVPPRPKNPQSITLDWKALSAAQQTTLLNLAVKKAGGWQGDSFPLDRLREAGITW
jgi:hypothetical protein